ncbi:hypothetical protein BDV97DRAFT_365579 [Delphinella strobiligena]|nr:hypothetical protein BDV97DRAFT_365579 [Delphinella strobiligena]
MRFSIQRTLLPLACLFTTLLTITPVEGSPSPKESWSQLRGLSWNVLFGRGSGSSCPNACGWNSQLCCASYEACYTDSSDQAQCSATTATTAAVVTEINSGYWNYYTTVYTQTDLVTVTSTYSSWCASTAATNTWVAATTTWAAATSTASASCDWNNNESACGDICCASDQYCYSSGQCSAVTGGSSYSYYSSTESASAAVRPTSSSGVVVTATSSPTTTVPYIAPVATGANITLTGSESSHSGGLSGGAIAGIVIGVLLGLFLLALLILFCCARGIWVALFGGRRRRTTEREEYYESHRHRSGSGAAGAAGGRTWYGRPARVETSRKEKTSGAFGETLGIAAALAGLAAILGLKRSRDRRREEEKSDLSSNYYSYYTSESSASSDDRRTRDTRRSSRTRR